MNAERPLPPKDLDFIETEVAGLWPRLKGARIFITGATGFFGRWLLESLLLADKRHALGIQVVALSREPTSFLRKAPHLVISSLIWERGSVETLPAGIFDGERFDAVIHLATEANLRAYEADPVTGFNVIVEGTRRALAMAERTGARRFLFTSSGAAYGPQPPEVERFLEDSIGFSVADRSCPYGLSGEAKRHAEAMCAAAGRRGLETVIARCFTFAGPALPLDSKFAFGNFMKDAIKGGPIAIKGDGTPLRSYLYAADLAVWLWTLLLKGRPGRTYNVGSERPVSILELAEAISRELGVGPVQIMQASGSIRPPERYVPSTQRAQVELGLTETISLTETIRRTAAWHGIKVKH